MNATRMSFIVVLAFAVCSAVPSWSADAPVPPPAAPTPAPETTPGAAPKVETAPAPVAAPAPVPPPAPSSTPAPPASVSTPPSVTVIDAVDARGILGRDVRSPAAENMGRIADVIVDRAGQVRAAVIDFGGFLGVGSRKIVVEWAALHFWNVADKSASITLELTREQVRAAPEYKDDAPIVVLGASGLLHPLRFQPLTMQER
ncbi:MAG: PRC-barrel domain-containing protein [Tardiphaga sp.]